MRKGKKWWEREKLIGNERTRYEAGFSVVTSSLDTLTSMPIITSKNNDNSLMNKCNKWFLVCKRLEI